MKFLVTGGEGFIGRNLVSKLRQNGHSAATLDIAGAPDFKVNILDFDRLSDAVKGMDGVFHLAAVTSPPQFETDLPLGFNTNVNGTLNVLKASVDAGVKRAAIASSSAIYGDILTAGNEELAIPGHKNMYATTKLFDEYIAKFFHLREELKVVSLRYFNAYGMGENTKGMYSSVPSKFLESIRKGEKPVVFGDGTQSRDFVFVKDVAAASYAAMLKGESGESYNVGTGNSISFNDIVLEISSVLGRKVEYEYAKNPFRNYQMFTKADISKITSHTGWRPDYTLRSGVMEMATQMELI